MSVLNKKPFIQELIESLSGDNKTALLNCLNGNTSPVQYSLVLRNLSVSTPVESIQLETKTKIYNGYKIYVNNKITFIMYGDGQDLSMYQVDYPYYERELKGRIKEPININELRRYLETDEGVGESVSIDEIDSGDAAAGKVIKANGEGGAVWSDDNGLPPSTKANQVLVSDDEGGWDEKKSVPLADNLLAAPVTNDALYSAGPTGGLADISTGEEAYLQEVKGMSIVWNQLCDGVNSVTLISEHKYVRYNSQYQSSSFESGNSSTIPGTDKLYDLTLMFGGNDKIPFSLASETEYPANGTIPAQTVGALQRFQRLFANVDLANAPYDAGTIKNVSATTLVETGQNLWNSSMETNGLKILAGYRYEIYLSSTGVSVKRSLDGGSTWNDLTLYRYQRADGKYVWTLWADVNMLIKSSSNSSPITYVGFVHSGNYCLTTGTVNSSSNATTDVTIPTYSKHEYSVGLSGLNGLTNSDGEITVYDTKDYTRVGSMDLSQYQDAMVYDGDLGGWTLETPSDIDINLFDEGTYLSEKGYHIIDDIDENDNDIFIIYNDSDSIKPTGILLYPLSEPVATGQNAFEPIAIDVNDMGLEYFIQPANTNCPVNQVSYYYENLKDKLVNLQEPIEVSGNTAGDYFYLRIGSTEYAMPKKGNVGSPAGFSIGSGTAKGQYSICISSTGGKTDNTAAVAIGKDAHANGNHSVALGSSAEGTQNYTVAIGYGAQATQESAIAIKGKAQAKGSIIMGEGEARALGAIAIGAGTYNGFPNSITFDGNSDDMNVSGAYGQRTLHMRSPEKIFFRNAVSERVSNASFSDCVAGHYLSEYITNNALVQESGTNKFYLTFTDSDNFTTFTQNKVSGTATAIDKHITGVHITVKLSTDAVVGLDLILYDTAGHLSYGICSANADVISAYIDSDGIVIINPPSGVTVSSATYYIR